MTEFSAWFDTLPRSNWGELATLRDAHARRPTLARETLAAVADGSLALSGPPSAPVSLASLLEWVATDGLAVPPALLLPHLDGPDATWAAGALGHQWRPEICDLTVALLAEATPERRALGFQILARALQASTVQPDQAARLLPLAQAGSKRITRKLRCPTAFVIEGLEGLQTRRPEVPPGTDVDTLAKQAPTDPTLHTRAVALLAGRSWMGFEELADRLDLPLEPARALAASLTRSRTELRWSERGLSTSYVYDEAHAAMWPAPPNRLERLALDRCTAALNDVLQPTARLSVRLARRKTPRPALRWTDGTEVTPRAADTLVACMTNTDPVSRALVALLDPDALTTFGHWLLSEPARHRLDHHLLPPSESIAREVGRAWTAGTSKLRPWEARGLDGTRTHRRNLFRWWVGASAADRYDLRLPGTGAPLALQDVLPILPTAEELEADGTEDAAWWTAIGHAALRDAMADQTWLWTRTLRALARHPIGDAVLENVVFVDRTGEVQTTATGLSAPELRVACARVDSGRWPAFVDPLEQRAEALTMPDTASLTPVPSKAWHERTRALGYTAIPDAAGGSLRLLRKLGADSLVLQHSGTGRGYGRGPVTLLHATTERGDASGPAARDALARDVSVLLGRAEATGLPMPVALPAL